MVKYQELLNKKVLDFVDILYLSKLLNSGLSIKDSLSLVKTKKNEKKINTIVALLDSGSGVEETLGIYLPKKLSNYCTSLIKIMPFYNALDLSIHFYNKTSEIEKIFSKSLSYPLLLLFISISGLFLFNQYGLDAILSLIRSFHSDTSSIEILHSITETMVSAIYFSILLISVFLLIMLNEKRIVFLYIVLAQKMPNCLLILYYSELFVSTLLICYKKGYKSKQSLEIIKSMKKNKVLSFMAYHLDEALLSGDSFDIAMQLPYFDNLLSKYMKIAIFSNDFEGILNNYVEHISSKIKRKTKLLAMILQFATYLLIGLLIVFIYQVLFLPMQIISEY